MRRPARRRLRVLGVVSGLCFVTLVGRMVELQVAERPAYAARAEASRDRRVPVEPAPGQILDRRGRVLAATGTAYRVTLDRTLGPQSRQRALERLAVLLGTRADELARRADDRRLPPMLPALVADDVPPSVVVALRERPDDFPGIGLESRPARRYPHGALAAQTLAAASAGVEAACRPLLAGHPGVDRLEVDRRGHAVRRRPEQLPEPGRDVRLTLDLDVQRAAETALAKAMDSARTAHPAPAGAVVVLDAGDGSVLALASAPSFEPAVLTGRVDPADWAALNDPSGRRPLANRAVAGLYAPGSTFKAVTALAGLTAGVVRPETEVVDRGALRVGGRLFRNDKSKAHGPVDLTRALAVSSDVYFYALGQRLYGDQADGPIQDTARRLGLGEPTHLGIGREPGGVVPGPQSRRGDRRGWYPGDAANLAVGQGDLLVTPLQLAAAYGALVTAGRVEPRLFAPGECTEAAVGLHAVGGPPGNFLARSPTAFASADGGRFDAGALAAVRRGLRSVVADPDGTAAKVFAGSPVEVAGKTGTAQVAGKANTALFAGVAPASAPRYVAVAVVEEAGYGSVVAAPIVRRVLEAIP
jgi:penicillin-binding protein 2